MDHMDLKDIAQAMRDIDFCMFSTRTDGDAIASRPMSNNREVEYDGTSRFFSYDEARTVSDIAADPGVSLAFQGKAGLLGKPPLFIAAHGRAAIARDRETFRAHWTDGLERWFQQGTDTPGLVMITVTAERLHYWDGEDQGELLL